MTCVDFTNAHQNKFTLSTDYVYNMSKKNSKLRHPLSVRLQPEPLSQEIQNIVGANNTIYNELLTLKSFNTTRCLTAELGSGLRVKCV